MALAGDSGSVGVRRILNVALRPACDPGVLRSSGVIASRESVGHVGPASG
jgi:hypothetical protein